MVADTGDAHESRRRTRPRFAAFEHPKLFVEDDVQRIQVKKRTIVCVISRLFALYSLRFLCRAGGRRGTGLRKSFNESMRESYA